MADKYLTIKLIPTDGSKKFPATGSTVSGADINALWHAWNAGEIPDPADGDEVVQPKSRAKDLSKENSSQ
jgi:hypothetical protein